MNSEFNTANFLPKIYVDNQVNDTCNVENIYGKSWVNSNNIEYMSNNISLLTYSRACSCPDALCLCHITVRYGYPCSIEDIQVYIRDSFKHQTHHTSIASFDIFQDCKVYIETGSHLKLSGEIHSTDSDKVKNNSKIILVNVCNNAGCSADDTYWFTNTSFTCSDKQAAYMCQVGARNVNIQLGILDYASQICTNMTLYGGVCRDASIFQITDTSHGENHNNYVESYDQRCLRNCLDQYVDLTDLDFQPRNYNSQATNSFKLFSILSSNYTNYSSFSEVVNNTYLGESYYDNTDSSNADYTIYASKKLAGSTVSQIVDRRVQYEVTREFGFMPNIANIQWSFQTPTSFQYTLDREGITRVHLAVKVYNLPNYKGARIPVISGLKMDMWRYILKDYDLKIIGDYLQYGFPLNIDHDNFIYNQKVVNHASAIRNPNGVNKYFNTEIQELAMVGPMKESPFAKTHYSPMMTRDKPDGSVRVIVDLSWPIGKGVNNYVPGDIFDEIYFTLKYPNIDLVVEQIRSMGPTALLFKVDLQRAFRNLRIDPLDYPLLGLKWQGNTYIDVALAFGFKNGAAACQLCTDIITDTLRRQKIWLMNYLDDYIGISHPNQAEGHFQSLLRLLDQVGLPVNKNKVEAPSSIITCLGIQIDANKGILSIPDKKLHEIKQLTNYWLQKTFTNRRQLQSYIGKLIAIHRCVKPSRLFINRMLRVLRNTPVQGSTKLPGYFFQDVRWFHKFLDKFNGSVEIHPKNVKTFNVFVDASLQCTGGIFGNKVYSCEIPQVLKDLTSIVQLEAANVVMACKLWGNQWRNSKVYIWCDNMAVVAACQSGKIRDNWLMACCRTLWWLSAVYNLDIVVKHIYGSDNVKADILSRWHVYKHSNSTEVKFLKSCKWENTPSDMLWPDFKI